MVACLQEIHPVFAYHIHQAMLFRKSPGPGPGWEVFEGLRFSDAGEWVAENSLYQIKSAQSYFAVCIYPITQIFDEFRMKYPCPLASGGRVLPFNYFLRQDRGSGAVLQRKKETIPGSGRG